MLQAFPTKNGTGISIFGDYGDLQMLYQTIHHFSETLDENRNHQKAQHELLMNFAYEVRKAVGGQRLVDKFSYSGDNIEHNFYGFQLVWTDIIIFINSLRWNAGYARSEKLHQAALYLLEYLVEKALFDYDAEGAEKIKPLLERGINVADEHAFIIYQAVHIKHVSDMPGKKRFRNLPNLLVSHFANWKPEYKNLIASFQQSAQEQNCAATDLEFLDFPEVLW